LCVGFAGMLYAGFTELLFVVGHASRASDY
jgi:hypothetical protein